MLFTVAVETVTVAEYSPTRPRSWVSALFPSPTKTRGFVTVKFSALVDPPPNDRLPVIVVLPAILTDPAIPTPPTTVSAPVVDDVEGVSISICTFTSGVMLICSLPEVNPPAAKTILFSVPFSPVARTRLPAPVLPATAVPEAAVDDTLDAVFA